MAQNRMEFLKALVGLIILMIGNLPPKARATETVMVNYALETGSADYHVGAGLGGPWSDVLPDSLISLIKPSAVRIGNLWQNSQHLWERAAHNHTTVVVVVKDAIDARPEAPFLDKDFTDHWNTAGDSLSKMTAWKGHVRHWVDFAMAHRIVGEDTVRVQYDIWNEPDMTIGGGWHPNEVYNSIDLFFDVWNTAVDSIRAWDPEAIITGPSFAYAGNGPGSEVSDKSGLTMELFLQRCYGAGTLPDVLGSHHIGYSDYTAPDSIRGPCRWNLYAQVADLRDRVNAVFGNIPESGVDAGSFKYEINEMMNPDLPGTDYCGQPYLGPPVHVAVTPGVLVRNFALAERARADGLGLLFACRTVWPDPCSPCLGSPVFYLAHLLDPCAAQCLEIPCEPQCETGFRPRYAWWTNKAYADITGNLVQTSASGSVDAIAGIAASSDPDTSKMLVGNYSPGSSSDLRIILNNLDATDLVVNDAIQVTVKRLPGHPDSVYLAYAGLAPLLISSSRLPVSGNSAMLEVPSNQFGQGDALQIEVTRINPGAVVARGNFPTVEAAIQSADIGDTVLVVPDPVTGDPYRESNTHLKNGVKVMAKPGTYPVIVGSGEPDADTLVVFPPNANAFTSCEGIELRAGPTTGSLPRCVEQAPSETARWRTWA